MNLNDVNQGIHRHKPRKRLGRGPGSGHGKTSGRGHKGARSRSGHSQKPTFEGGQMPLVRRIPKRGFHNRFAPTVAVVNVGDLERKFAGGEEVNPETLRSRSLAKGRYDELKILGEGRLTKALTVAAHRFSRSAREKIEQAGGTVVVLPPKAPVGKQRAQQADSSKTG